MHWILKRHGSTPPTGERSTIVSARSADTADALLQYRTGASPLADLRYLILQTLSTFCWRRGRPTDIYALGACLFTFVYGRIPFSAPTVYQLFQVVQTEPLRFPEEPLVSDDLKDLLSQMLIKVGAASLNGESVHVMKAVLLD